MTVQEITFTGVPAWLLAIYLVEMGGEKDESGTVRGEGWTAKLEASKSRIGSFALGRVTVTIEGGRAAETMAALRKKAMRGGG
jgi:hypothetical protein